MENQQYIVILARGQNSLLELESLRDGKLVNFSIIRGGTNAAIISCDQPSALSLISRLGGSYKIARILGNNLGESLEQLSLPTRGKFFWTVSAYDCEPDIIDQAQAGLQEILKKSGLGKSKFLPAHLQGSSSGQKQAKEVKAREVYSRILFPKKGVMGIDLILHGPLLNGREIYSQTIGMIDISGFDRRDFGRPFQDPKRTLSPQTARLLVNLAATRKSRSLLDPYCGLGTILAEGLLCNYNVAGFDRDAIMIERAKANLKWLFETYKINPMRRVELFVHDSRKHFRQGIGHFDSIATEPILLPVFSDNPSATKANELLRIAQKSYEKTIREFPSLLSGSGSKVVIVSPILVDSMGTRKSLPIEDFALGAGLKPYLPACRNEKIKYPLVIESQKKRIVQRGINVFYLS